MTSTALIPHLVAEFRAVMADPMGVPTEAQMRAVVEHKASALPQGRTFHGVWFIEDGERTLCEFDGCICFEAYSTAAAAEVEASRLRAAYGAGRYVAAPIPAGIPCHNRATDRTEVSTGDHGAVRFVMDAGFISVKLVEAGAWDSFTPAEQAQALAMGEAATDAAPLCQGNEAFDDGVREGVDKLSRRGLISERVGAAICALYDVAPIRAATGPILAALMLAGNMTGAQAAPRAFVLNQWGGVVSCDFSHNPYATPRMRAYCAGAHVPAANPVRFDCRTAEVDSEYRFCGKPLPTKR